MLYLAGGLVLGETMALWMTVEQEIFGLAAMLLVFSCAFVRVAVRGIGKEKGRRPAFLCLEGRRNRRRIDRRTVAMLVTVAFGVVVGLCRTEWEQSVIDLEEALVASCAGENVVLEGTVSEIGKTDYGSRLVLKEIDVIETSGEGKNGGVRKVYVYLDEDTGLKLGMKVRVSGEMESAKADRNPGQFDFRLYCLAKGICGSVQGDRFEIVDGRYLAVKEWLRQIGLLLESRLELIADEEDVGLLKAILLGEKGDMDDEVYKLYQKNGISHVLAISGLHVSVIGMGLWNGLRMAGAGYWSAGAVAFGILFGFGSVAGFGPSVVRAICMMGISFLAGAFGRTYDLPSAMSLPAMGLLLWNPYVLTQASFQLSFLAVAAIFFPGEYLAKAWKLEGALKNVWTSVSIQIVTLPVVLFHSFEIPVYSVFLNLVVVPLMTYVLVSGIFGLLGSFLWMPLGSFLLGGAHYILALYKLVCKGMGQVTGAYLILGRPSFWAIGVYYGCLIVGAWLCVHDQRWKIGGKSWPRWLLGIGKTAVFWSIGLLALLPAAPSGLEVTFLDVGQGDGIVVRAEGRTLLVDCGSSQEWEIGEDCLVPFLKSRGISRLDAVAVTHGDQDHINGVQHLLEDDTNGIKIGQLIMPVTSLGDAACERLEELAALRGIPVHYVSAEGTNQVFSGALGDMVKIACLHPGGKLVEEEAGENGSGVIHNKSGNDRNAGSLVLEVEYGAFRLLLTGDVESTGELEMAEKGFLNPVTVLKAGHHGSATSTSQAFLDAVSPTYVVFSYGAGNRYGHPANEVVARCRESGAEMLETAKMGAIQILTDGKSMQISGWLDRKGGI